jgi:hypothetical protein
VQAASAKAGVLALLFILVLFSMPCERAAFAAVDLPLLGYIHWAGKVAGAVLCA